MLKFKHFSVKTAAVLSLGLCCTALPAQDANVEVSRSIELAQILNDGQFRLPEYADLLIKEMMEKYPGDIHLQGQRIYNLLAQQKDAEALKEAEALKGREDAYMAALSSIGTFYVQYSKFDKGIPLLEQVVDYAFKTGKVKEYQMQMGWLLTAYENDHKADKATELKAKIQNALMDDDASKRDRLLSSGLLAMSSINSLRDGLTGGLEEIESLLAAKRREAASEPAKKAAFEKLLADIKKADDAFYASLRKGENRTAKNQARLKLYNLLGKSYLGLDENDSVRFANFREASDRGLRALKSSILLKPEEGWNKTEHAIMAPSQSNPVDWMDQIGAAMKNLDQVLWGGTDIRTAIAVGQLIRAYYYIGENDIKTMEKGLTLFRKYRDLYDQCDEAYDELNKKNKKDGLPPQVTPTATARMWEGYICKRIAEIYEKQNRKADALKMYKRAFVAFGTPLRKYWSNDAPDAVNTYPLFRGVKDKIIELDPKNEKFIASLNKQFARVVPPVAKKTDSYDELVDPVAAKLFKEGNRLLSEIKQKLKSNQAVTEKDWKEAGVIFDQAENEMLKKMEGKYLSNGLPKLLNHLMICYANGAQAQLFDSSVSMDKDFMLETLAEISSWMYASDEFVANGLVVSANTYWDEAARILGPVAKKEVAKLTPEDLAVIAKADPLKDKAINLYDVFLKMTSGNHKNAPVVSVRIAREEFIRADRMAFTINAEKDPAKRKALEDARIAGFDRSIDRYKIIINNYNNMDNFIYEAYGTTADAYIMTKRFQPAVDALKALCERSKEKDPIRMLNATMEIASHLYSIAVDLDKKAYETGTKMDQIVPIEPLPVEERLKKAKENAAANAKADAKTDTKTAAPAAAAPAAAGKEPVKVADAKADAEKLKKEAEEKAAAEKALREQFEKEFAEEKEKFLFATQQKEALGAEAKALHTQAVAKYNESIENVNRFLTMTDKKNIDQPVDPQKGIYSALRKVPKYNTQITANEKRAAAVLPWLHDGAGNRAEAVKYFEAYIAQNINADEAEAKKLQIPACMLRLAELYAEIGSTETDAAKVNAANENVSKTISAMKAKFPESPEVEKSKFLLVNTFFKLEKYNECLDELQKLQSSNQLSLQQNEWIVQNMTNLPAACKDPAVRERAANFAYSTSKKLLDDCKAIFKDWDKLLKNPTEFKKLVEPWVGSRHAIEFSQKPETGLDYFNYQQESLMLKLAETANILNKPKDAVAYFNELEKNYPKTGFRFRLSFGRAAANFKLNELKAVRQDLISVSNTAIGLQAAAMRDNAALKAEREEAMKKDPAGNFPKLILKNEDEYIPHYYKAESLLAETWEKDGKKQIALNRYKMLLGQHKKIDTVVKTQTPNTPEPDGRGYKYLEDYLEEAHYQGARLAKELDDEETFSEFYKRYLLLYPEGRYKNQLKNL